VILERYAEAINKSDPAMMASLFAPQCFFSAGGGRTRGAPDHICESREEVLQYFATVMGEIDMKAVVHRVNPGSMEYDIVVGDNVVNPCVGVVTVDAERVDRRTDRPPAVARRAGLTR